MRTAPAPVLLCAMGAALRIRRRPRPRPILIPQRHLSRASLRPHVALRGSSLGSSTVRRFVCRRVTARRPPPRTPVVGLLRLRSLTVPRSRRLRTVLRRAKAERAPLRRTTARSSSTSRGTQRVRRVRQLARLQRMGKQSPLARVAAHRPLPSRRLGIAKTTPKASNVAVMVLVTRSVGTAPLALRP